MKAPHPIGRQVKSPESVHGELLLAQRLVLWLLPLSAAVGGSLFEVDLGPIPIYPFKVIVPLVFAITLVTTPVRRRPEPEVLILSLLLTWAAVGAVWAVEPAAAVATSSIFAFAIMLFATLHFWGADAVPDLIMGWRVALAATALVALGELATGLHLPTAFVEERGGAVGGVVLSVFTNPNDFGAFLAIAIPISLFPARGRTPRWAWPLAAGSAALLLIAASRFALLGLAAAGLVVLVRYRRKWWSLLTGWLALLVGLGSAIVLIAIGAGIATKVTVLFEPGAFGDTSAGIRIALAANGLWAVARTGGVGLGGGGFEPMVRSGDIPVALREGVLNPHNMWIELVSEFGVVGITLFGALLAVIWRRATAEHRPAEPTATILWMSLASYVLAVCTSSSYVSSPVSWTFLATASLISLHLPTMNDEAPDPIRGYLSTPHAGRLERRSPRPLTEPTA